MRQIAGYGEYYNHHDLDDRVVYRQVGQVWQWRFLLKAWDRFQRHQLLDNDDTLCTIADVLDGARRRVAYVEDVVVDRVNGILDPVVLVHPVAVRELLAGCREIRAMMDSDAEGTFLGYEAPPVLDSAEEFNVRQLIRRVEQAEDQRIVRFQRCLREAV